MNQVEQAMLELKQAIYDNICKPYLDGFRRAAARAQGEQAALTRAITEQRTTPQFVRIGNRSVAIAHIVSVETYRTGTELYVHVSLTAATTLADTSPESMPNVWILADEEAARFLVWWDSHDDVVRLD